MARAKGDGSLYWDQKRTCWFVRVTYQDPKTGETKRKKLKGAVENTPKGKSVSLKIGQKWLEQIEQGMFPDAEKITLEWSFCHGNLRFFYRLCFLSEGNPGCALPVH